MNILGSLSQSSSAGASLNSIDFAKIARMALVLLASGFITFVAPKLGSFTYVFHGIDFTNIVTPAVALLVETLRRFIAGNAVQ